MRAPLHIFLYGIFRTKLLRHVFQRPAPDIMFWDRAVMCEIALSTRFYSAAPVRFFKYANRTPVKKRYKEQTVGSVYNAPRPYSRYVGVLLQRLLTSPIIPFWRKFFVFVPWGRIVWLYRRSLFYELTVGLRNQSERTPVV